MTSSQRLVLGWLVYDFKSPVGHPTAYEKFVMNKHMEVENTQKIYLSGDFPIFKSIISRKINL